MTSFELRVYAAVDGKMPALLQRFREHTMRLFEAHGMVNIGYWIDQNDPNRLIYLLKHTDFEASWDAFRADSRWVDVKERSEADGPLTASITSTRLDATDFSPLQ
ncbi:MAG: NIPSNAP family protein [Leucobacter sp.]